MKLLDITRKPVCCKACFKDFTPSFSRMLLEKEPFLCDECISEIQKELVVKDTFGVKTTFLSNYDGILKNWLMNYKEYGDIMLASCFLHVFLPLLRLKFPGYIYVPLPSAKERIEHRGFDHLPEMLKASNLPYCLALEKVSDGPEQKTLKASKRFKSKGIRLTSKAHELEGKKIVLFDDVMTSGSTFEQSYHEICQIHPKKVVGLILLDNFDKGME